jgi:hypothetical protein
MVVHDCSFKNSRLRDVKSTAMVLGFKDARMGEKGQPASIGQLKNGLEGGQKRAK